MSNVRYTKEQRARAKKEGKPLFTLAIDRRHVTLPNGKLGSAIEYSGPADDELVQDIADLINKHLAREKSG